MARPRIADQRTAQILDAFEGCVVRNGLDGTTLEDVAREAGQPRSLVRYFAGNRAEMVSVLIDRMVERSTAKLRERLSGVYRGVLDDLAGRLLPTHSTDDDEVLAERSDR